MWIPISVSPRGHSYKLNKLHSNLELRQEIFSIDGTVFSRKMWKFPYWNSANVNCKFEETSMEFFMYENPRNTLVRCSGNRMRLHLVWGQVREWADQSIIRISSSIRCRGFGHLSPPQRQSMITQVWSLLITFYQMFFTAKQESHRHTAFCYSY